MALIVQKFGGTSVGSLDRIKNVANKVLAEINQNNRPVVVVSAMSGETNRLVGLMKDSCKMFGKEGITNEILGEYDAVISTGEQVSAGILASMIIQMGHKARSFNAWQVGFKTNAEFSKASIENIESEAIMKFVLDGGIPIITGFQGMFEGERRITTIGRGGSDTSAVAIAAAIKADRCDIYTDVDGIYTCDPRVVKNAKKIDEVGFEEMVEMASSGSKVLHVRSVILAMNYGVVTRVLSSFGEDNSGGSILKCDSKIMEKKIVTAISLDQNDVQIALFGTDNKSSTCFKIFDALAKKNINVDMIVQCPNGKETTKTDLAFTINNAELHRGVESVKALQLELGFTNIEIREDVAKVSVIGAGMKIHAGVAAKTFEILARENINIIAVSTSEIKISILVEQKYAELATRALHDEFIR